MNTTTNTTTAAAGAFLTALRPMGYGLDPLCGDCRMANRLTCVNQPVLADFSFVSIKKTVYVCERCARSRGLL